MGIADPCKNERIDTDKLSVCKYNIVLLAGPISHTSTQYIDFVYFLHFTGFVYHLFYSF